MGKLSGKKVALVIAPKNFRDEEYFQPKVVLQSQGAEVITVAKGDLEEITGTQGGKSRTDVKLKDINPQDYEALVFVGGSGAKVYFNYKTIHKIAQAFIEEGKVVGAICIAPSILANAGVLKGKKVTSFASEKSNIKSQGANWQDKDIVIDGQIVTANGPEAAIAFGDALVKVLTK